MKKYALLFAFLSVACTYAGHECEEERDKELVECASDEEDEASRSIHANLQAMPETSTANALVQETQKDLQNTGHSAAQKFALEASERFTKSETELAILKTSIDRNNYYNQEMLKAIRSSEPCPDDQANLLIEIAFKDTPEKETWIKAYALDRKAQHNLQAIQIIKDREKKDCTIL